MTVPEFDPRVISCRTERYLYYLTGKYPNGQASYVVRRMLMRAGGPDPAWGVASGCPMCRCCTWGFWSCCFGPGPWISLSPSPFANLSQCVHKQISRPHGIQQRQPAVATEREEVQMAASVIAPQTLRHERPSKTPRVTPPHGAPPTCFDWAIYKWYPLLIALVKRNDKMTSGPPARETDLEASN